MVGFNAQAAVDAKHKLIAAADVTNEETDVQQLANVARQAKENLGVEQLEVVADQGYYSNSRSEPCAKSRASRPTCAQADTSANTPARIIRQEQVSAMTRRKTFMFVRRERN